MFLLSTLNLLYALGGKNVNYACRPLKTFFFFLKQNLLEDFINILSVVQKTKQNMKSIHILKVYSSPKQRPAK